MTRCRNKIKPIIAILVILSFIWVNFNLSYYSHIHIDEHGKLIVHAHPFARSERHSNSATHHTHTKSEYIYLSTIYTILTLFIVCILLVTLLLRIRRWIKKEQPFQRNPGDIFREAIFRRGPPAFQYNLY